ncbi:21519_t:CDS:2, partial [Gigaspora margarita]
MKELEPFLLEYDDDDLTKLVEEEPKGRVHLNKEQHATQPEIPKWYITELLEIGANYEAKQLEQAIDILKIALPDTIFVFGFDNSSRHGAFTEDALIASKMNIVME